jgi:hypothetical protein
MLHFFDHHILHRCRKRVIGNVVMGRHFGEKERVMTPSAANKAPPRRKLLTATIARLSLAQRSGVGVTAAGPAIRQPAPARRRVEHGRAPKLSLLRRITRRTAISGPDPVSLAVLAIDRLGPAAVRACASGVAVCVKAPDEATAAVLRAALDETARRRCTDRLIRIVVD